MSFMKPQITNLARWIQVDGPCGIDSIPFDVVFNRQNKKTMRPTFEDIADYTENREAYSIEVIDGYGVRLSAPGYMDCTCWEVFTSEEQAESRYQELIEECKEEEEESES